MAEEKKTKAKKSTAKKPAAKKAPAKKSTTKPSEPKLAEKSFDMNTPIRCRSVRQNDLIYVASNGITYTWNGFGDLRELPYQEVVSMKSRRSKFLYEPWLLIEDADLLNSKMFAGEFDDMYKIYKEFEDPKTFFSKKPSEIKEVLKNAPNGLRDLIVYNAGRYIDEGVLDSIGVVNAIDDVLGTQLRMLL